jgi:hypothetical protein
VVNVLIAPSYGGQQAQGHWAATLDQEIDFLQGARSEPLSAAERDALTAMHPTGKARFWGAVAKWDEYFDRVEPFDVVLFTGQYRVLAIGEVGVSFRNTGFADSLWEPNPDSWWNVYSLVSFQRTTVPYAIIQAALGYSPNYNFPRFHLIEGDRAATLLSALRFTAQPILQEDVEDAERALRSLGVTDLHRPVEPTLTQITGYTRSVRDIIVKRAESALVTEFTKSLPSDHKASSLVVGSGVIDLHVDSPQGVEIIEAKSSSRHRKVRESLGQILDYAHSVVEPVDRIATLFPTAPAAKDIAMLRHYGVAVIYRNENGTFTRFEADDSRRECWRRT